MPTKVSFFSQDPSEPKLPLAAMSAEPLPFFEEAKRVPEPLVTAFLELELVHDRNKESSPENPESRPDLNVVSESPLLHCIKGQIEFHSLLPYIQTAHPQTAHPYWIPSIWPLPIIQKGHCCALYALEIALRYAYPHRSVPPARKKGDRSQPSLRQIAKEKGYSAFGEIFNVDHLQKIAQIAGYYTCSPMRFQRVSFTSYCNQVCFLLREGHSLILSCDLGGTNSTPAPHTGHSTHWALIFGYFHINDHCYFLVTQYGKYYVWSAATLYESNAALPGLNPRMKPLYFYIKKNGREYFVRNKLPPSSDTLKEARYCSTRTLLDFQFTGLATPTLVLEKSLQLPAQPNLAADNLPLDNPSNFDKENRLFNPPKICP